MGLDDYSTERLEQELARRKEISLTAPKALPPHSIHFEKLRQLCIDYIEWMATDDYYDGSDHKHYIFEAALEATYGKDVWEWINRRMK